MEVRRCVRQSRAADDTRRSEHGEQGQEHEEEHGEEAGSTDAERETAGQEGEEVEEAGKAPPGGRPVRRARARGLLGALVAALEEEQASGGARRRTAHAGRLRRRRFTHRLERHVQRHRRRGRGGSGCRRRDGRAPADPIPRVREVPVRPRGATTRTRQVAFRGARTGFGARMDCDQGSRPHDQPAVLRDARPPRQSGAARRRCTTRRRRRARP